MAGWLTNGMQPVAAIVQNGSTLQAAYVNFNLTTIDVPTSGGTQPVTAAATAFQIATHVAGLVANQATSTAGAATLNTMSGLITTEALTTAPGATYTFTLTNSLITSTTSPAPQVQMLDKTNTGGATQINSITNAAGSSVFVFQNTGTSAWNGTRLIAFHI
jgi:hypothetical protein